MTVVSGKRNYNYPKPGSRSSSDSESLHLGSDTESLPGEPCQSQIHRPTALRLFHIEEVATIKKTSGKKKRLRYQNTRCVLQTLNEEDGNDAFVIMENCKSPFARLLEDADALDYWNSFVEKSEEEQTEMLQVFSERFRSSCKHGKLSSRLRRTIKINSLDTVKRLEDELIEFFKATPHDV
ncbi:hypothetical protein NQ315_007026 [Exocentrus adspersus]|uniref:R3H-associated N-terminal domain-containing protein n=1 Tax=Exocentrus adspersus TaxID=1586481 RepID=A0AAV8WC57_9CUCU|nr:hypothetical protein NQ315_007026 [Exocentrus adspersus]